MSQSARKAAQVTVRVHDAAAALAGYTVLGWLIATGGISELNGEKVAAARQQVALRLAQNPQFTSLSTRARLGEEIKLLFITMFAGWEGAQRESKTRQFSDGVAAMFRTQVGQDLRKLALTRQGFVDR